MTQRPVPNCEIKSPCAGCNDRTKTCIDNCCALKFFQGQLLNEPCFLQAVDSSGGSYQFAPVNHAPRRCQ